MPLDAKLLRILACPKCKSELTVVDNEEGLACATCNVVYPIREEIPVMLVEEAIATEEWTSGTRKKQ